MGRIIEAFKRAGLSQPVIVGGAPVNPDFAARIGAQGYAENAPEAVELVKRLMVEAASNAQAFAVSA